MKRKISSKNKTLSRKLKDFIKRNFKKLKNIDKGSILKIYPMITTLYGLNHIKLCYFLNYWFLYL